MKTQREAVYLLKSALAGGTISDDFSIPNRRLLARLRGIINMLKHRNLDKGREFTNEDIIVLPCIELMEIEQVECPITPSGQLWQRSVNTIPDFIKLLSVTDVLGRTSLPIIGWDKLEAHSKSRIKAVANSPVATFRSSGKGTYIYALTPNKVLSATIVPSDYAEATLFPACGEVNPLKCDYWNIPIGASDNLVSEAIQFLLAEEIKVNASVKADDTNNDNPS